MLARLLGCCVVALGLVTALATQASPAGYGTSYWEAADVQVDAVTVTALGTQDAAEECTPVELTGNGPDLTVYPVLNMVVLDACVVGLSDLYMEGPVVLAGGMGHGRDMPANVTITTSNGTWDARAVECQAPAGAVDPPRVMAYPVLDVYTLDGCRLVPGATWDAFTVVLDLAPEGLG